MKPFSISRQWFRETQNAKKQNFITKKPKNQHKNTHIMKSFSQSSTTPNLYVRIRKKIPEPSHEAASHEALKNERRCGCCVAVRLSEVKHRLSEIESQSTDWLRLKFKAPIQSTDWVRLDRFRAQHSWLREVEFRFRPKHSWNWRRLREVELRLRVVRFWGWTYDWEWEDSGNKDWMQVRRHWDEIGG